MPGHRIFTTSFASLYPLHVAQAERKGRTRGEVDEVIRWLTGYDDAGPAAAIEREVDELAKGRKMTPVLRGSGVAG